MFFFSRKSKRQYRVDESDERAIEAFWRVFAWKSPRLVDIARSMEAVGEERLRETMHEYEVVVDDVQSELWKMLPKTRNKLFFTPLCGELKCGKFEIHVSAERGFAAIKYLLIRLMPKEVGHQWKIEDLDEVEISKKDLEETVKMMYRLYREDVKKEKGRKREERRKGDDSGKKHS